MARTVLVSLLVVLALVVGYLANGNDDAAPARAGSDTRAVRGLEIRVLELERRLALLASRIDTDPGAPNEVERAPRETPAPDAKQPTQDAATPADMAKAREEHKL
jgi:hypothetical protein